jgi:site-specific DNA-methyltransferase (adenine-specific)
MLNKVTVGDCRKLLPQLAAASVDCVIADGMYGVKSGKGKATEYDWGNERLYMDGTAESYWRYHEDIYQECRRVLRPGGTLAWASGCKHQRYFNQWFGGHRIWSFAHYGSRWLNSFGHIWVLQSKEQTGIRFPDADSLIICPPKPRWRYLHPCPKHPKEMEFLVRHLSKKGGTILDPFCGIGTTLSAAKKLHRNYIGFDLSPLYVKIARLDLATIE